MLYLESLNTALHHMMSENKDVILVGEDLLDPYGGAFRVSKGLSTAFPSQVITTPISESAIVGLGIGMALRDLKPIVEIMFGDFLALAADQIINHATKYRWMFNNQVNVPIVIRTPMGGGRGYGPTHSQSLESMFLATSGLSICAPSIYHDPGKLLYHSVMYSKDPVLFIENKSSYAKKLQLDDSVSTHGMRRLLLKSEGLEETVLLSLYPQEVADLVIITYGGMAEVAVDAAYELFLEEEILIHVVVISELRSSSVKEFLPVIRSAGRVLTLEEGALIGGWGGEMASQIQSKVFDYLKLPIFRLGAEDMPIPSALPLEKEVLPTKEKVIKQVKKIISGGK